MEWVFISNFTNGLNLFFACLQNFIATNERTGPKATRSPTFSDLDLHCSLLPPPSPQATRLKVWPIARRLKLRDFYISLAASSAFHLSVLARSFLPPFSFPHSCPWHLFSVTSSLSLSYVSFVFHVSGIRILKTLPYLKFIRSSEGTVYYDAENCPWHILSVAHLSGLKNINIAELASQRDRKKF